MLFLRPEKRACTFTSGEMKLKPVGIKINALLEDRSMAENRDQTIDTLISELKVWYSFVTLVMFVWLFAVLLLFASFFYLFSRVHFNTYLCSQTDILTCVSVFYYLALYGTPDFNVGLILSDSIMREIFQVLRNDKINLHWVVHFHTIQLDRTWPSRRTREGWRNKSTTCIPSVDSSPFTNKSKRNKTAGVLKQDPNAQQVNRITQSMSQCSR